MLRGEKRIGRALNSTVFSARERRRQLVVGLRNGHVGWMAVAPRKLPASRLLADLH